MTEYGRTYFVYTSMEEELQREFEHLKHTNLEDLEEVRDFAAENNLTKLSNIVGETFHQYRKRREDWRRIQELGRQKWWSGFTIGVVGTAMVFFLALWWMNRAHEPAEVPTVTSTTCTSPEAPGYAYSCLHDTGSESGSGADAGAAHGPARPAVRAEAVHAVLRRRDGDQFREHGSSAGAGED